jgi:hypothetical protein
VGGPEPASSGDTLVALDGEWTLDLNGKQVTTPLKSWEDLGSPSFAGPATYRKQFTAAAPTGKRVFLEIADVHDYARVALNGKQLDAHAWQPYRWDVTSALKSGSNELEVEVRASATGRGGAGAAAPSGGRGRGGAPPVSGLLGPVRLVVR